MLERGGGGGGGEGGGGVFRNTHKRTQKLNCPSLELRVLIFIQIQDKVSF